MKQTTRNYIEGTGFLLLYGGLGAVCYRLFLRQAIGYPGVLGRYDSDLRSHITEGIQHTAYSLMERTFGFLMGTLGLNEKSVAIVLSLVTLGTVLALWALLRELYPAGNRTALHLIAFACLFVMPLYLPSVNRFHYMGMQTGSIWHNSTYQGMRLIGTVVLIVYLRLLDVYREKFSAGQWFLFTALLVLVNMAKPNFILCFAPAMAVQLLSDCIADRGRTLGKQIVFGIPVLISLAVVLQSAAVLFPDGGDSSIVLGQPFGLLYWNAHPAAALLQSAAFPLLVLMGTYRELGENRRSRMIWLTAAFALAEYLFLTEDGPRSQHGNMSWGYCFTLFLLFAVCAGRVWCELQAIYQEFAAQKEKSLLRFAGGLPSRKKVRVIWAAACALLFLWHLGVGLPFFRMLYLGGSFMEGGY